MCSQDTSICQSFQSKTQGNVEQLSLTTCSGNWQRQLDAETPAPEYDTYCYAPLKIPEDAYPAKIVKELMSFVIYNSKTGEFIATRKRRVDSPCVGAPFTNEDKDGYRRINVLQTIYQVKDLVWLWHYGKFPAERVDHINGNPRDDRIENLRETTHSGNMRNRRMLRNNTSGETHISWHAQTRKYKVQVLYKYLGRYATIEEAIVARDTYLSEHPELGFTARHGKP